MSYLSACKTHDTKWGHNCIRSSLKDHLVVRRKYLLEKTYLRFKNKLCINYYNKVDFVNVEIS